MSWDRAGAVSVAIPNPLPVSGTVDVSDRAGRLLGVVTIDGQPISVTIASTGNGVTLTDTDGNPVSVEHFDDAFQLRTIDEEGRKDRAELWAKLHRIEQVLGEDGQE